MEIVQKKIPISLHPNLQYSIAYSGEKWGLSKHLFEASYIKERDIAFRLQDHKNNLR